mmetsp:Transcript_110662/g.226354  ORF Transcript_110662/g.226354 Transcript_110662/m.226354 type:complete len:616 (+) Transcript_110662:984-2831(+)
MADCSAAGTTIDRAARAIIGGAGAASATSASKHVGALLGHASMFTSGAAATAGTMPLVSPDHLVMPGTGTGPGLQTHQSTFQNATTPSAEAARSIQQQQQQYPVMMHHPATAAVQTNLPVQFYQHQLHQQQQFQVQMQMQQQQQQQAMTMMLHQQQQQQQFLIRQQQQQQQQLEESKARAKQQLTEQVKTPETEELGERSSDPQNDWHEGLEEAFLREQLEANAYGEEYNDLAAAWADAEAEYDNVLQQEGGLGAQELLDENDYSNLWEGEMDPGATKPYEFINSPDERTTTTTDAAASIDKHYMDEGMKQFQEGNIRDAIKSFEMELQLKNTDNAKAWRMLGKCHAENDQDPEAIQCFEASVDRDPFCPEALLALGVSYVNELNHERALENMKAWFTHNPKYAAMELSMIDGTAAAVSRGDDIYGAAPERASGEGGTNDNDVLNSHRSAKASAFDEVKGMLLAALEFDPTDAGDVYEALGVIYNVIKDYDAAVDSFRKALQSRPDDYQLWNKLGATLANGSQSDQALPTYHQSLKLKPKYARAWLNMAISHSNLSNHDEAARCYLQTLSLNPAATHCWTYLRMSLSSNERWDLLPLVFERNLSGFREHFDFVSY